MPVSRAKYLVISLFLLSLTAWIVEGLIAGEKITFSTILVPNTSGIVVEIVKYLIFLVFFAMTAGALIVMILDRHLFIKFLRSLLRRQQKDSEEEGFKRKVLAWTISLSIVSLFMWFMASGGIGNLSLTVPESVQPLPTGEGAASLPSPNNTSFYESPLMPTLLLIPGFLLIAAVFVFSLLFVKALRETREDAKQEAMDVPPEFAEEALKEEALTVVGETISEITASEAAIDLRAAIIKCYQRLCELLAEYNCRMQKHETVQEFKISASKLLNIPDEPLSTLTSLFEEARYSLHEIDEAKTDEALKCLEEIKNHLTGDKNDRP